MADGAAAMILCSSETAQLKYLIPLAKIISWAQTGIDPLIMVGLITFVLERIDSFGTLIRV